MQFINIRDLKYVTANNSVIDLLATCKEYGEIPMTLNLVDTEDLHTFFDGEKVYPLEEYCKTQNIAAYIENKEKMEELRVSLIKQKAGEFIEAKYPLYKQINITNLLSPYTQDDKNKMIAYIDGIRRVSNEAEAKGTALEDIDWGV